MCTEKFERTESEISMMGSWSWLWIVFMFVLLLPPLGYGWGYRGWGVPYPRYVQRRRAAAMGGTTFNYQAWGFGGDFVWIVAVIGLVWVCVAFWWR